VPFGGHKLEIIIYCTRLQCESKQNRKQRKRERVIEKQKRKRREWARMSAKIVENEITAAG